MLAENTERLISNFETKHQMLLEQARLRQEQQSKVERAAAERVVRLHAEAAKRRPLSPTEIATVERETEAIVRQKYDVDPDAPGWRGLVLAEAHKLLGR